MGAELASAYLLASAKATLRAAAGG